MSKIEAVSDEDLNKVEAYIKDLTILKEQSNIETKLIKIEDFSFAAAKKLTQHLKSALADEVIKERDLEKYTQV